MKTKKLIVILAMCLLPALTFGQSANPFPPQNSQLRHEIGISGGPISCYSAMIGVVSAIFVLPIAAIGGKGMDLKYYGGYGLHYYYQVLPWLQVGVKTTAEAFAYVSYTDSTQKVIDSRSNIVLLNITPSVKFTYLNRPWVRLYSGIDVGLGIVPSGGSSKSSSDSEDGSSKSSSVGFYPALNITPIGVNVGKGFFGFVETNFGSDTFIKAGIGARW